MLRGDGAETSQEGDQTGDVFVMDQSIIDKLNEAVKQDKVSQAIKTELADILKILWTQKVRNTKMVTERLGSILRPENCEFFAPRQINTEIYGKIRKDVKDQDERLRKSETFLSTAAISIASMMDKMMSLNLKFNNETNFKTFTETIETLKNDATNAFTMVSYSTRG